MRLKFVRNAMPRFVVGDAFTIFEKLTDYLNAICGRSRIVAEQAVIEELRRWVEE